MGPFIAILAAILTFAAFWIQYAANVQQRNQFEKELENQRIQLVQQKVDSQAQEKLSKIERFETRFFELIKLHKENVNEININKDTIKGRKAFVYLFQEFRFSYALLKYFITNEALDEWFPKDSGFTKIDEETITNLAFLIFFIEVGENSDPLLYGYTKDICSRLFLDNIISFYKS